MFNLRWPSVCQYESKMRTAPGVKYVHCCLRRPADIIHATHTKFLAEMVWWRKVALMTGEKMIVARRNKCYCCTTSMERCVSCRYSRIGFIVATAFLLQGQWAMPCGIVE